jgi:hypothetical protein
MNPQLEDLITRLALDRAEREYAASASRLTAQAERLLAVASAQVNREKIDRKRAPAAGIARGQASGGTERAVLPGIYSWWRCFARFESMNSELITRDEARARNETSRVAQSAAEADRHGAQHRVCGCVRAGKVRPWRKDRAKTTRSPIQGLFV